jgi:NADP-dependent 3-hydroxy acid dehydrogenase YdfG
MSCVVAALRQMSQARHVGKVVVRSTSAVQEQYVDGAVLVVGGTGTLGSLMVRWLSEQGVRYIPVASRTGKIPSGIAEFLAGGTGSTAASLAAVTVFQCDTSSAADLAAALADQGRGPPLLAVLHAGGVLADATFGNQSLAALRPVMAAKVAALHNVRRLAAGQPVASTVLFSSVAALLGAPGQANYSAANAALDSLAGSMRQRGEAAVSVQWGAWAGAGMAANDAQTAARVERTGMGLLAPAAGLAALAGVLAGLQGSAGGAVPGGGSGAARAVLPSWCAAAIVLCCCHRAVLPCMDCHAM